MDRQALRGGISVPENHRAERSQLIPALCQKFSGPQSGIGAPQVQLVS